MKVLAFAASNSRKSINKDPIRYASTLLPDCDVDIIDVKTMKCPSTTATLRWPRAGEGVFIEYLLRLADARRYEYVITLRAVETIEQERPEFVKYCKNKSGGFY
ncbi:MAG: hypothetical protein ACK2UK_06720 [Candidatus Promineifilaceae bacterium]